MSNERPGQPSAGAVQCKKINEQWQGTHWYSTVAADSSCLKRCSVSACWPACFHFPLPLCVHLSVYIDITLIPALFCFSFSMILLLLGKSQARCAHGAHTVRIDFKLRKEEVLKIPRILNSHLIATNKIQSSKPQPRNQMQPFGVP